MPEGNHPQTSTDADMAETPLTSEISCDNDAHVESFEVGNERSKEEAIENIRTGSDSHDEPAIPNVQGSPVQTNKALIKQKDPGNETSCAPETITTRNDKQQEEAIPRSNETGSNREESSSGKDYSNGDAILEPKPQSGVPNVDRTHRNVTGQTVPTHIRTHQGLPHIITSHSFTSTDSDTDNGRPKYTPRGPRTLCTPRWPNRMDLDVGELQRIRAKLMKTQDDLEAERWKNKNLRKEVEMELQRKTDVALSNMINELFHKQADVLDKTSTLRKKELESDYRNRKFEQLEIFLAEGQKQLVHQLEQQGIRTMSAVEQEFVTRQVTLDVEKQLAARENHLNDEKDRLKIRADEFEQRYQQYRAIYSETIEDELREKLEPEIEARIAQAEYERGFQAGKEAGYDEKMDDTRNDGFMEGYTSGIRTQKTLIDLRSGLIPLDSPEVAFLFDLNHPNNLFNRGVQAGQMKKVEEVAEETHIRQASASFSDATTVTTHCNVTSREASREASPTENKDLQRIMSEHRKAEAADLIDLS